jgi:hypothetical protein
VSLKLQNREERSVDGENKKIMVTEKQKKKKMTKTKSKRQKWHQIS